MVQVIKHISLLAGLHNPAAALRGPQLAQLPVLQNAWLLLEDGQIAAYGSMDQWNDQLAQIERQWDASGRVVLPAWCDSHTHLVFACSREEEFRDKIQGLTYAAIAAKGGGILNSARALQQTSEDELFRLAWQRLQEAAQLGTGALEIKSGYGLTLESELKMLRVIRRLQQKSALTIKSTFLGAHAIPETYKDNRQAYIQLLIDQMLPAIAAEQLADYIDVFCEEGFYTAEETELICRAGMQYGLKPKLHVNQLNSTGGIETGINLNAVSLDHLEVLTEKEVEQLAQWKGICTLLPTAAFFLRMPFQPARKLIDAGAAVALASDFNPGSSPSFNMNLVVSMSCIGMRMLPEEAVNAATINGAFAMECAGELGSIAPGKRANLIITKPVPSLSYLPYAFGSNLVDQVFIDGEVIEHSDNNRFFQKLKTP
jgi:imidazolonepropionase